MSQWNRWVATDLHLDQQVKEFNQEGVIHIHQQEYFKIRNQMPTVRDTLKHGEMKLIIEVLEVPTAQSDVGHATMLVTLLHIVVR